MSATPAVALEEAEAPHRPDTAEHVTATPLGNALGAEIGGLDLARPFTPAELEAVRTAIQDHHLLCFRDQHLASDEQVAFSTQLGPLEVFPEQDKTKGESTVYNVANVSPEGEHLPVDDHRVIYQKVNARWHTDSSYRADPRPLLPGRPGQGPPPHRRLTVAQPTRPPISPGAVRPLRSRCPVRTGSR